MKNCQSCGYNGYSYAKTQNSNEQTKKIVLIIFGAIFFLIIVSDLFIFGTAKVFFSFLFDQINEMETEDKQSEENQKDNFDYEEMTFDECKNKCGENYIYSNGLCMCADLSF